MESPSPPRRTSSYELLSPCQELAVTTFSNLSTEGHSCPGKVGRTSNPDPAPTMCHEMAAPISSSPPSDNHQCHELAEPTFSTIPCHEGAATVSPSIPTEPSACPVIPPTVPHSRDPAPDDSGDVAPSAVTATLDHAAGQYSAASYAAGTTPVYRPQRRYDIRGIPPRARFGLTRALTSPRAVPMAPRITTFRAHPLLNDLPNMFVYDGSLRSGTSAGSRRLLLDRIRFPRADLPFMFLDFDGASTRALSRSHFNDTEADICRRLITRLRESGIRSDQLTVITFYKEQHRRLAPWMRDARIELATVDSIQGRENDIIVLLTTRTDLTIDSGEFLDDPHRMNVALTRCRHGQFVLGHMTALRNVPTWDRVLGWAMEKGCVVPAQVFGSYFK